MLDIDLLRRDECQPLTTEQMTDIKSQFHPSSTANVNMKPYMVYSPNEQVIGEWQEEVDGVLKKKSLYEKRIDSKFARGTIVSVSDTFRIKNIEGIIIINDTSVNFFNSVNAWNGNEWATVQEYNSVLKGVAGSSTYDNKDVQITIKYVKTTDEWEEV